VGKLACVSGVNREGGRKNTPPLSMPALHSPFPAPPFNACNAGVKWERLSNDSWLKLMLKAGLSESYCFKYIFSSSNVSTELLR